MSRSAAAAAALMLLWAAPCVRADDATPPQALVRGWATLRAMDCARCHGRDHDGWAAPSLIEAVRSGTRERFMRLVLDGDIERGMPGYRSQPAVVAGLDDVYAYLQARAAGTIGPGKPGRD
jgi:cytochrome c55X